MIKESAKEPVPQTEKIDTSQGQDEEDVSACASNNASDEEQAKTPQDSVHKEGDFEEEQPQEASISQPQEVRVRLVGVRLRPGWPVSHFLAGELKLTDGEWVVVPTDHGIEVGQVVGRPVEVILYDNALPPEVERLASTYEIEQYYHNLDREKEAWKFCAERIKALGLSMKLVRVESFFNGSKIIFYYSAEERVDFRELVKDLVRALRTRVEMRQIGVRHEAKMIGGIGSCGRELCCASFLQSFDPISIRMAKAQNLPLNPSKISGLCGRLLCCLTFEYDTYLELIKDMPTLGKSCDTPAGEGKVIRQNVLRQTVTVILPGGGEEEFTTYDLIKHQEQKEQHDASGNQQEMTSETSKNSSSSEEDRESPQALKESYETSEPAFSEPIVSSSKQEDVQEEEAIQGDEQIEQPVSKALPEKLGQAGPNDRGETEKRVQEKKIGKKAKAQQKQKKQQKKRRRNRGKRKKKSKNAKARKKTQQKDGDSKANDK